MRELIVVRHGESEGNARGLAQGPLPYPLTERGRAQARRVGEVVRALGWEPEEIVSSPLLRCVETAAILREVLDLGPVRLDEAFTEIDCGRATGRSFEELRRDHPEFFAKPLSEWRGFSEWGGESDARLEARVGGGLDALAPEARVLLVTHGAVFKAVLGHLLGLRASFFLDLRNDSVLRLERRRFGPHEVLAWTHYFHALEWPAPEAPG